MAILEVEHLEKRFGGTPVLQDVSFSLEQGQTLAILGSSGSVVLPLPERAGAAGCRVHPRGGRDAV